MTSHLTTSVLDPVRGGLDSPLEVGDLVERHRAGLVAILGYRVPGVDRHGLQSDG